MSANHPSPRILIIGLDGATFDLILPWVNEGKLPHFAHLLTKSSYGTLLSTHPPATFPAWTTFMTGKNPGKHGIYDFTQRKSGSYEIRFLNSTFRKGNTIWQLLSEHGKRVGVMGVPATYPPEPLNGFTICGFDSPVATGIDGSFVYPKELYGELKQKLGEYKIADFQEVHIDEDWHEKALSKILENLERKAAYTYYLFQKEPWDCFMVLFGESDTVSHHFWMFHDRHSPRYDQRKATTLGNAILTVYQKLDEIIGTLLSLSADDTCLMLLSDHGFGGAGDKVIYLNRWLEQNGYLCFKTDKRWLYNLLNWSKKIALEGLPPRLQEAFFRKGSGSIASKVESLSRFGLINWGQTSVFSEELNYFPSLWINLKGREPGGIVAPGYPYEKLRDELIEKLSLFINPLTNEKVVKRAYKREELYQGDELDKAPDIILELNLDQGYSYSLLPSSAPGKERIRTLTTHEFPGAKGRSMNGSHRREGMVVLQGPPILKGEEFSGASLMDLAPTILYLLQCPIPPDMDGKVIREAFYEDFLKSNPIHYEKSGKEVYERVPKDLTDNEERTLKARLKGMGYF